MNKSIPVNCKLGTFRHLTGTKLPNKYICFEENFEKLDHFRRKTQIPRLSSFPRHDNKFRSLAQNSMAHGKL